MSGSSADLYDFLAPHYQEYAAKKSAYLASIDRFILGHVSTRPESMLDVGSGDGVRAMALARHLGVSSVVLSDPSAEMAARCRQLDPGEVWGNPAEDLPDTGKRFDIITCLWNVLGHLPDREARVKALIRMSALLSSRGRIVFDVNNRHNAAAYGWLRVLGRIIIDAVRPDERRGDASFDWQIGDTVLPAKGHLFTLREIEAIIRESGLRILERVAVDYSNGGISRSSLRGQLLYLVAK